jgi:recombination protein RecT
MQVNQSLPANPNKKQRFSVAIQSDAYKNLINNTLGDPQRAVRFISTLTSAVSNNPKLQECEMSTVVSCGLLSESLNLSVAPGLNQGFLIPFNDKKNNRVVCTFQIGTNGYKQLAMRTGQYLDIDAIEVRQGEYKGRDKFTGKPIFEFVSDDDYRESLPIIGFLAYFELLNGFKKSIYFSMEKTLKHADKYSQSFSKDIYEKIQAGEIPKTELWKYQSPWYSDTVGQGLKTVIKQLLSKWGILSTELIEAIAKDQGVPVVKENQIVGVDYVDNRPEEENEIVHDSVKPPETPVETIVVENDPLA